MIRRRRLGRVLRTDDQVAPGMTRRRAPYIAAAGIVGIVVGILIIVAALQSGILNAQQRAGNAEQKAGLTATEVTELRSYLADRRQARQQEADEVDQRLDEQNAALCAALGEVATDASPSGYRALSRAGKRLGCDPLPRPTKRAPASNEGAASSSGDRAAGGTGSASTSPTARERPVARSTPPPHPSPRASTPPPPRAEPPSGDPPPEPGPSRGPITGTVCNLVGLCL